MKMETAGSIPTRLDGVTFHKTILLHVHVPAKGERGTHTKAKRHTAARMVIS
jgi:hypothetical protein